MNTRPPSLRRCQRSSGAQPSRAAVASSRRSTPAARSSGVNSTAPRIAPTASSALQPKISSAPADQLVMTPCGSVVKMAWSLAPSTTSRSRSSRSPKGLLGPPLHADVARDRQDLLGRAVGAEDRRDDHVPVAHVALGGGRVALEPPRPAGPGLRHRVERLRVLLALPEVRPVRALERAEIVDLHHAEPAGAHELEAGVEREHLDAIREALQHAPGERLALAQGLLGVHALRHVGALGEDARHPAVRVLDRLVDEIDEALLDGRAGRALQADLQGAALESLALRVDPVEQLEEALALDLGQRLPDRLPDHVAVTDELHVGRVDELEDVLRPAQHRHEAGRLLEEFLEALALGDGAALGQHLPRGLLARAEHAARPGPSRREPACRRRRNASPPDSRCAA